MLLSPYRKNSNHTFGLEMSVAEALTLHESLLAACQHTGLHKGVSTEVATSAIHAVYYAGGVLFLDTENERFRITIDVAFDTTLFHRRIEFSLTERQYTTLSAHLPSIIDAYTDHDQRNSWDEHNENITHVLREFANVLSHKE